MVVSKRKRLPLITYTSRDFESIKNDLNDYRRRYYPNISRDNSEASFDDMMLDTVAYVGDILSFYVDYSVNETFLDTAVEFNNVLRLGRPLGYKFSGNPSSTGIETFFIIIPANATGLGPDPTLIPLLKKNTELSSVSGNGFILVEDVVFSDPNNPIVVARVDQTTGIPTAYAIKAYGKIISGRFNQEIISIGNYQRFMRVQLAGRDIAEIIAVVDGQGNEYFEVENLSQDTIYKPITNTNIVDNTTVPNVLRPFIVPRRFTVERDRNFTYLQFGFGSDRDTTSDPLVDPAQVVLNITGKNYVSDVSFDPSNILGTNKLGIVPANTQLSIIYRVNTSDNVNATSNAISVITNPLVEFANVNTLNQQTIQDIVSSMECTNEQPVVGDVSIPTVTELKYRIFDKFSSQNRAVTLQDYKSLVYSMPPKFGAIKRINIVQDHDTFKRNLSMYVISQASDSTLTTSTQTLKQNVMFWINQGRMINDSIDIIDAKIVNLRIDFIVLGEMEINKFDIINNAINDLKRAFIQKEEIGAPFMITKIYKVLQRTRGVLDVLNVKVSQQLGSQYSNTPINLDDILSPDGRYLNTPANVIFEIKYFDQDIKGSVK